MKTNIVDVFFHIRADLPEKDRNNIERDFQNHNGVYSANFFTKIPRLLLVKYNPDAVNTKSLRKLFSVRGLTSSIVGM